MPLGSMTVGVPLKLNSLEPIEIKLTDPAIRAAFVERYAVNLLPPEWDKEVEGFYVLLSHIRPDNSFTAYVGKTDWSFSRRLQSHLETKDFWNLAILFKRNADEGFTRDETTHMEGALVEALSSSPNVTVTNIKPTGNRNISDWDKEALDSILLACLRILFLRGYRNAHMGEITENLENREQLRITPPKASRPIISRGIRPPQQVINNIPPTPQPEVKTPTDLSDEEIQKLNATIEGTKLREVVHTIVREHPELERSYKYWASKRNTALITYYRPQTIEDLKRIPFAQTSYLNAYLNKTEMIVSIFAT